jgi:hypothetical protein
MPVNIELQRDNRIAVVTWSNPVIHDDFMKVFSIMEPIYQVVSLPVHSIYIADGLTNLPPRAISIYLKDPRSPLVNRMSGLMVVVTNSLFIRMITDTAAKLSPPDKLKTAQTIEGAMTKIEKLLEKDLTA